MATIDMGRKEGLLCPFRGELGPRLIQCGLGRGLLPYQVASSSIQPFGYNRHGPKIGRGEYALFPGGSWIAIEHKVAWAEAYLHIELHLTPSSRLHGHNGHWPKNGMGSCAPLGEGELGLHLSQCGQDRGLPACQVSP